MKKTVALILALVLKTVPLLAEPDMTALQLIKALPINGPENNQPSGLTIHNGELFSVSDKHDDTIYRISLGDSVATFVPHLKFKASIPDALNRLDFEGITCDKQGNFYVASETGFRVLRVSAGGKKAEWITENLKSHGDRVGLFTKGGGYIEGIAREAGGRLILAAERQARGILEVDPDTTPVEVHAFNLDKTHVPLKAPREPSFTGLYLEHENLFALDRSTGAVYKLGYRGGKPDETDIWTYGDILNREDLKYESMRWGLGEGLCLDKNNVYVIIDNNGAARASNPEDKRPMLLIMKRPK